MNRESANKEEKKRSRRSKERDRECRERANRVYREVGIESEKKESNRNERRM